MPKALITGITGQDGSYLTEFLLEKGYEVHGTVRRTSSLERSRLRHLYRDPALYNRRLFLHYADLDDPTNLRRILVKSEADEVYHLGGQSHVGISFEIPESTCELTAMATLRLLEMFRDLPKQPKLYHASSSEIFGRPEQMPQNESTPILPVNPYGCAKAFATQMTRIYRQEFGLFAANGIMYNHESPRRGENFVSRKVCQGAAAIKLGLQTDLILGDLQAQRDWGHARDYVQGMWLCLQAEHGDDFVFATGRLHNVQNIVETAFGYVGLDWKQYVKTDPRFIRHGEPTRLVGDASKAREILQWEPTISFQSMIEEMTESELRRLKESG